MGPSVAPDCPLDKSKLHLAHRPPKFWPSAFLSMVMFASRQLPRSLSLSFFCYSPLIIPARLRFRGVMLCLPPTPSLLPPSGSCFLLSRNACLPTQMSAYLSLSLSLSPMVLGKQQDAVVKH